MTPEQAALVEKARESLAVASMLCEQGHHDFSASRAYYAMFYLAEALLLQRGLAFSKHSAVISAFGRELVKSGAVPATLHNHLRAAEASRIIGDYESLEHVSEDRAREHLRHAEDFLQVAERLFES